jgi:hypothetical protein
MSEPGCFAGDWGWKQLLRAFCRPGALGVLVVALLVYGWTYLLGTFGSPVRADGAGYAMYLPAWVIHHSFGVEAAATARFGAEVPEWTGCERVGAEGRLVDKYGVGAAVMALPFFLAAHGLTWAMRSPYALEWWAYQFPMDGWSGFYPHAIGLAGLFWMWVGVVVLHWHLRRYFARWVAAGTVGLLVFGTNLLHYMAAESVLSHGYSLALFALLLVAVDRWRRGEGGMRTAVFAGVVAGFIGMVRASNLAVVPCALLWGIGDWRAWRARVVRGWRELLVAGLCCAAVFSFQLWTWKCMSGHWVLNAYGAQGEGFAWWHPAIANVLFSLRGGVFFWCPVLLTGVAGLFLLREGGGGAPWRWATLVYALLQLWVVASWHDWPYGGGFGHRGFIETYALWAFPMAAWAEWCEGRSAWARWANRLACFGCVAWCLFFMKLYFVRELSYFGLDRQALFDIFYNRFCAVREWVRGAL